MFSTQALGWPNAVPVLQVAKRNAHGHAGVLPLCRRPFSVHHKLQHAATLEDNLMLKSLQNSLHTFNLSLPSDSLGKEQLFRTVILQHIKQLLTFALQN